MAKKIILTDNQKKDIINFYNKGLSTNKIEILIGVGRKIITKFLQAEGVEIRYQVNITKEKAQEIIDFVIFKQPTLKEINTKFKISNVTIHKVLKENNISLRKIKNNRYKNYEKEVIDFYLKDKLSIKEIIQKSKIKSESKIFKILAENNVQLRKKKCDYSISNDVIEMYKSGNFKIYEIANLLNVSKSNVIKILKKEGVEIIIGISKNIEKEIIDLYTTKLISLDSVAKIFNLTNTTIFNILKRNNIKIRSYSQARVALSDEDYDNYLKSIPEFIKYRRKVLWATNQQPINTLKNFDKRGKAGQEGAYNLDHKYSILEGFKNKIDHKIIGHIHNLEMLPWKENMKKNKKCSITLDELINKIKEHENQKS